MKMPLLFSIPRKWRAVLILIAWMGANAFTLLFLGTRPFVIDHVDFYYVSDNGAMLATCTRQANGSKSSIRFWDLHQGGLHSEYNVTLAGDSSSPDAVIFSSGNKRARACGQEFDLINKTVLPYKQIPYTKELPETVPWDQIFFDEDDRVVARWLGEYRDTATMTPVFQLKLPDDWHSFSRHGNLLIYWHEKSIMIVDGKRRTKKTIALTKSNEDGFGIAPSGDYCGYFETDYEFHLFSVDEGRVVRRVDLRANYSSVEISPHGVFLLCRLAEDAPGWLDQGLEMLGVSRLSVWHLIDPVTGQILCSFQGDNHDSVLNPMFTADNSFVLAFDPQRSRLSVWELPVHDRTILKIVMLIGFSLTAIAGIYNTVKGLRNTRGQQANGCQPPQ